MSKAAFSIFLLLLSSQLFGATYSSTSSGGDWSVGTTWSGGSVPGSTDDVIINGPVYLDGTIYINNVTINSGGSLQNEDYYTRYFYVSGNVTNNGTILNSAVSGSLYVYVQGNILNNGTWKNYEVSLTSTTGQTIGCGSGKSFTGIRLIITNAVTVSLSAQTSFESCLISNSSTARILDAGGYSLVFDGCEIINTKILSLGDVNGDNSVFHQSIFKGDIDLYGTINVADCTFDSLIHNHGTIQNRGYYTQWIKLYGEFTNSGTVRNHPTANSLYLTVYGHLINQGTMTPYSVYFTGGNTHQVSQVAGTHYLGSYYQADASDTLQLESDCVFGPVTLSLYSGSVRAVLKTNGHKLSVDTGFVTNFTLIGTDTFDLDQSTITSCDFYGNPVLDGEINISSGVEFVDPVTLIGTLQNKPYYTTRLSVKSLLTNYGVIRNHPVASSFYIDLTGDVHNEGEYRPYETLLKGSRTHDFSSGSTQFFTTRVTLESENESIGLKSDVRFMRSDLIFPSSTTYAQIQTNGYSLMADTSQLYYVSVKGDDSVHTTAVLFYYCQFDGNMSIAGDFKQAGCVGKGTTTVYADVMNRDYYSDIYTQESGTLINRGTFRQNPVAGSSFGIVIHGHLSNYGTYIPNTTTFTGKQNHQLWQMDGTLLKGHFYAENSTDEITMLSDITIHRSNVQYSGGSERGFAWHTNGFNLHLDTCIGSGLTIIGNDTTDLSGSVVSNTEWNQNYVLDGVFEVGTSVELKDTATLAGTLRNREYYTNYLKVSGLLINHGTIENNPIASVLYVDLYGDIHNEGVYKPYNTQLMGQRMHIFSQSEGTWFSGYLYTSDTLDGITLGSDVRFNHMDVRGTGSSPGSELNAGSYRLQMDTSSIGQFKIKSSDTISFSQSYVFTSTISDNYVFTGDWHVWGGVTLEGTCVNHSLIRNRDYYTQTLTVKAALTNRDTFRNSEIAGGLNIDLHQGLVNEGWYAPYSTTFIGSQDQEINTPPGHGIHGYVYGDDQKGRIVLAGPSEFKHANIRLLNGEKRQIVTNGFSLSLDSTYAENAEVVGSDSIIGFASELAAMLFTGSPKWKGTHVVYNGVVVSDTLFNYGVINNRPSYTTTLTVNGPFINSGTPVNNPAGGNLYIDLYSDLNSTGFLQCGQVNLLGKKSRTIYNASLSQSEAQFYARDTFTLTGENRISKLTVLTDARLRVDDGANLQCLDLIVYHTEGIRNYGKIQAYGEFNPNSPNTVNYYHASAHNRYNTTIENLTVEAAGHQQHPFTEGAVNAWWRFKSSPIAGTDSLQWVNLTYESDELNGNQEDLLKVFFSANGGLNWSEIGTNIVRDTLNNTIRIDSAPPYGHFVLSASGLGIISFKPVVDRAEPRTFGNSGKVTLYGFGLGLQANMTVELVMGATSIPADSVYLTGVNGESFTALFDVDLIATGKYDLRVTVPGEQPIVLSEYITVEKAERPEPWVILGGRPRFLVNRWQTFTLAYGNHANMDAGGVPVFLAMNHIDGMEVKFPDVQIGIPSSYTNDGWTQWKDTTIGLYYITDSLAGHYGTSMRIYPFYIPTIGAKSAQSIRVMVKVPVNAEIHLQAWLTDPLIETFEKQKKASTPPEVAACLAKAAAKYTWDKAIGFIPGYDCYKLAYKVTETGVTEVLRDKSEPEKPQTWGSWMINAWGWAWSVADCAGDLIPVAKGVKVAKELIDIGFDMKGNYDANQECWDKFRKKQKGKFDSRTVTSMDPNEITGPVGFGSDGYVGVDANMFYTVYFENKDSATAPATEVVVYDTINKDHLDFTTFSFNNIVIADSTYAVQGFAQKFRLLIDMAPRINCLVQVTGELDTANGAIEVQYTTLDRSTLELNEDVDLGFLPPNKTSPEGEGNFSYSVSLKTAVQHDAQIINKALIYFDGNKPIATNVHQNRVDRVAPESMVASLSSITEDSTFTVSWSGSDDGCGIESYNVFVSENDSAFKIWKSNTSLTSDDFQGHNGYRYAFYSVAVDSLGLSEGFPETADAETTISVPDAVETHQLDYRVRTYPNPAKDVIYVDLLDVARASFELRNVSGVVMRSGALVSGENQIATDGLSHQIYVLTIELDGGTVNRLIEIRN
ncbi:MAG: hypothetical protein H6608_08725 [Flavobacteriales bacterium]|nr:hypothetical protein [Flavobacteriales bacterium]